MRRRFRLLSIFILLSLCNVCISQEIGQEPKFYPEAPIEFRNNILFSNQIIIGFEKHLIIPILEGKTRINGDQLPAGSFYNQLAFFCEQETVNMKDLFVHRAIPAWPSASTTITNKITKEIKTVVDLSLIYIIHFPKMVNIKTGCRLLKEIENIAFTRPPAIIGLLAEPNDSLYTDQWYLTKISAAMAWDISTGLSTKRIAIIDAQPVCQTHPDLEAKITGGDGQTTTQDDHGTAVAGVAAAVTNNYIGIAGLGWMNEIYTYRSPTGKDTDAEALSNAISSAISDVDVINLSFHIGEPYNVHYGSCTKPDFNYSTRVITDEDFPDIRYAIAAAISAGVIVVAAGGNTQSEFYCRYCQHLCPEGIYGPIWPAAYPGVIGVSGTNESDVHVQNYNYGSHIDVCAPATNIKTTMPPDQYTNPSLTWGTSYSAPLVAAEAALIRSINPNLSVSQVETIIKTTALDLGTSGRDDYYGWGRINAHAALLKVIDDLAPRFSASSQATAYNNSRKLLKSGSNLYLVYESGNQIYFTKSTNDGSTWSNPPMRLSNGTGKNNYPSITGTSSKQFVVWQRVTGTNTYDTWFTKNTGSGWSTAVAISRLSGVTSSMDPVPVISYKTTSRIMVAVKGQRESYNGLLYQYSDNDGGSWSPGTSYQITSTTSSHQNPGLSMGPTTPASAVYLTYDEGSSVYYNTYTSSWGTAQNASSGCGTSNNRYASVEVDASNGRNLAWQGYSTPLEMNVIVHRRNSEAFQNFTLGGEGGNRPSITGLTTTKRAIICQGDNATDIYKIYYNGSNWTSSFIASNAQHPGLSAGTTTARYYWTSGTGSPYEIKISSESLSKTNFQPLICHRAAVLQDSACTKLFWVEIGEIWLENQKGEKTLLWLLPLQAETFQPTVTNILGYLETEPILIGNDATQLYWQQNIYAVGLNSLTADEATSVDLAFQLVNTESGKIAGEIYHTNLPNTAAETRIRGGQSFNITDFRGQQVKLQLVATGLSSKTSGLVPGVVEVYFEAGTDLGKEEPNPANLNQLMASKFHLEQNYPNPFNAETIIYYELVEPAQAKLTIYNLLGEQMIELINENQPAGRHQVRWQPDKTAGAAVPSGIYWYELRAGKFRQTRKMLLIR